jgi:hypothetical protein
MTRAIKESDWKVFRELRSIALERFCQRILDEIQQVAADADRGAHERYLALHDRIRRRDREIADAFNDLRRSTALQRLLAIRSHGLLTDEELGRFSPEVGEVLHWTEDGAP